MVHKPVPTLNEHIGDSITKYFTRMKPSVGYPPAIIRYNWNIEYNSLLRLEPCMSSYEHLIQIKLQPAQLKQPPNNVSLLIASQASFAHNAPFTPENVSTLIFRVERQTLRKLPKSGDILFTIGILQMPLKDIAADNERRETLIQHLKDDNLPGFRKYHRKYRSRQIILDYLENYTTGTNQAKL